MFFNSFILQKHVLKISNKKTHVLFKERNHQVLPDIKITNKIKYLLQEKVGTHFTCNQYLKIKRMQ